MDRRDATMDRRTYVKLVGGGGAAGVTGLAGCISTSPDDGGGSNNSSGGGNEATTIVPGTAPGFKPFEYMEGGDLVGFDVDLLTAVVEQADGYTLGEWNTMDFKPLTQALKSDRIDVIAAAMTITEDRKQSMAFTDPYYNADQAILVADDSGFSPSTFGDLAGHAIGAQDGTTGADVVQSELVDEGRVQQSNFNTYGNYVLAVEDLVNGNIDAVVVDTPVANTFVSNRPVTTAFTHKTGERYGFGVRKQDDDLRTALNQGLEAVRQSGTYDSLTQKWFQQS